jgi:leucyl aminopeptidase
VPTLDTPAFLERRAGASRPLWLVPERDPELLAEALKPAGATAQAWAVAQGFRGEQQRVLIVPSADGAIAGAVVGLGQQAAVDAAQAAFAGLSERLPDGSYHLAEEPPEPVATRAALGWALGRYRYQRYKEQAAGPRTSLVWPAAAHRNFVTRAADADALARDLINTPATDLDPEALAETIAGVARKTRAQFRQVVGPALLTEGYPAVHAVGRAAVSPPRVVELRWGERGPRVTLIGKGVCFDSGGLDLKPSSGMQLMKKDMGGAAIALALAQMLMDARLPIRLRLIVPAVENAIGPGSYHPGDVLRTRKGLSVEVGNTDAEGRLILADALTAAEEEHPDLLIDLATLTGAARVALGPELPALFCSHDALAAELLAAGRDNGDPLWQLPLWPGYADELGSKIADLANVSASPHAGAIIGALFLQRFVGVTPWVHLDLYAWNGKERPGHPVGAEAQGLRALYGLISARYGQGSGV